MSTRPQDDLSLAWSDHDFANGAVAGWNAAVAYMEIHLQRERDFWANNRPLNTQPVPTPFLDHINRTASEALAVIAKDMKDTRP